MSRRLPLADVHALAKLLPAAGPMLNVTADRYRFAVGLGAAMLRGQDNLMPVNHAADTVARLRGLFPNAYGLTDEAESPGQLPMIRHIEGAMEAARSGPRVHTAGGNGIPLPAAPSGALSADVPGVGKNTLTARVLTSGSTGASVPHAKRWGPLVSNTCAGAWRLAQQMGRDNLAGVTLVAAVPPQHMYGFESSGLVALLGGAAFDAGRRSSRPTSRPPWRAHRSRACWSPRPFS